MSFLELKVLYFNSNFTDFVPNGSIDNNSALVQVMGRHQTGDKPLPEPMHTHLTNVYMQH